MDGYRLGDENGRSIDIVCVGSIQIFLKFHQLLYGHGSDRKTCFFRKFLIIRVVSSFIDRGFWYEKKGK